MKHGFTLLELAIVLTIIGLIAGGIVAGSSMIRSAELRSLITELSQIRTSIAVFQEKYNELPGDMTNATFFWGAAPCPTGTSTGTLTCDGDGDGIITKGSSSGNNYGEMFTFWKHLENAEMISGTYTGRSDVGGPVHCTAENSFNSKMQNGLIITFNLDRVITGSTTGFDGEYRQNYLQFSGDDPTLTTSPSVPLLTPTEAWKIDTKFDDAKPAKGLVKQAFRAACTDALSATDFDADYDLKEEGTVCKPQIFGSY